jgi:hypothetical protein
MRGLVLEPEGDAAHNSTHDEQKLSSISINGPLSFRSQDISLKKTARVIE